MINNYFKLALRQLVRHKSFSFINLAGLSIGLAIAMLIILWAKDELSYDQFHEDSEHIYRVSWHAKYGANEWNIPIIPVPVGPTLQDQFPEVINSTHFLAEGMTFQNGSNYIREDKGAYVDENLFRVFTVHFIKGNPNTALDDPSSIVLTREMANRYFPNADPMGQTMINNYEEVYQVTGIVETWPNQSHLTFDYLIPIHSLNYVTGRQNAWGSATVMTYFKTTKNTDIIDLSSRFDEYVQSEIVEADFDGENNFVHFPFQKLTDIHLKSDLEMDVSGNSDITYIYLFGIIAIFILLLACINFTNLSTARSVIRAKEVGVRKMLGSNQQQLIRQFFIEASLYVLLASIISLILILLILPLFNTFTNKNLSISLSDPSIIYWSLGFLIFTSLMAGGIPALTISRFKPIQVLKGNFSGSLSGAGLRKTLVISQFVISISLISGSLIIQKQMNFLRNQKLGFEKEQVLVINQASALGTQASLFIQRLKQMPWVANATYAQKMPGDEFDSMGFIPQQPADFEHTSINYNFVDDQYLNVLGLELSSGRNFDATRAMDSLAFLINEKAAKILGWEQPLGRNLSYDGENFGPVVGVIKDFHYASMHNLIEPLIFVHTKKPMSNISIKMASTDVVSSIGSMENLWKEHAPKSPINYSFLDEDYEALYMSEIKMSTLFSWATALAILIACLGLYGLALFNAERRVKEIGVRKILGASVKHIVGLMAREYFVIIIAALAISIPFTWIVAKQWLMEYAFHTNISWWIFIVAGILALMVAAFTVSFHSIKVALAKPVNSLRQE